jgi:crotonobetainyl-CoA:carnitine CoA-transferase CaiB-like acyl-CoA transferase
MSQPLTGVCVLDFSTLLPGPLATLLLAEAGAEIIKIERPGTGDDFRSYLPKFGHSGVNFAMVNRGKRSVAIDLKAPDALARLRPLIARADILVEQFRPGVMDRLGLGYDALAAINPRIVYCAITGYGQTGPKAQVAAHDLNYLAESGLLGLSTDSNGTPIVPPALIADIAAGAYPAMINILLALRERETTGRGRRLDVAMADHLFTFMYWALGKGLATGEWPRPGGELITGGSPRYQIYRTRDGRFLAAAPLEQKFWENFCEAIELAPQWRDDAHDLRGTREAVAERVALRTSAEWRDKFMGKDVCCAIVASLEEALADPHFRVRGLFAPQLAADGREISALPVPVDPAFRSKPAVLSYPGLGENNDLIGD